MHIKQILGKQKNINKNTPKDKIQGGYFFI